MFIFRVRLAFASLAPVMTVNEPYFLKMKIIVCLFTYGRVLRSDWLRTGPYHSARTGLCTGQLSSRMYDVKVAENEFICLYVYNKALIKL